MFSVEYIQVCSIKCSLIIFFTFAKILLVLDSLSLGALPVFAEEGGGKVSSWGRGFKGGLTLLTFQKKGGLRTLAPSLQKRGVQGYYSLFVNAEI